MCFTHIAMFIMLIGKNLDLVKFFRVLNSCSLFKYKLESGLSDQSKLIF